MSDTDTDTETDLDTLLDSGDETEAKGSSDDERSGSDTAEMEQVTDRSTEEEHQVEQSDRSEDKSGDDSGDSGSSGGASVGSAGEGGVSDEEKEQIEKERQERTDPDNRPEGAEIDNTERDFNVKRGQFEDHEIDEELGPYNDPNAEDGEIEA